MNRRQRVNTTQAAKYLGLSESTLEHWRVAGIGPAFYKIGRYVTYTVPDLDAHVEASRCTSTRDGRAARQP